MRNRLSVCFGFRAAAARRLMGVKAVSKSCCAVLCILLVSASYCQAVTSITTIEELQAMSDNLTGSYELANDIDAAITRTWDNATGTPKGFAPIGMNGNSFIGTFNGKGHVIRNLHINRPDEDYVGLFGSVQGGCAISDLGLDNATVTGQYDVGGLVGLINGGSITSCYTTGAVIGVSAVGGLVGAANNGCSISTCSSMSAVTGTGIGEDIAGLVGNGTGGGSITACYTTGAVTGIKKVGGLVGIYTGSIYSCYSTGAVTGTDFVAGLAGYLQWIQTGGSMGSSYSTGRVTGYGVSVGGLVGVSYGGSINACYWDTQTSGTTTSDLGTGMTTADMKTKQNFLDAGWDFTDNGTWCMIENSTYPQFRWRSAFINLQNDSYALLPDTVLVKDAAQGLLANDTDTWGYLTAVLLSGPDNGTLQLSDNGSFIYTPDPGFSGMETISYTIPGSCDTATLTLRVAACAISIEPAIQSFTAAGGAGSITVTATNSICSWTAVSDNEGWLSITSGASGSDNGTVSYTVVANTGASRTGTIIVAGKTFTVNQEAFVPTTTTTTPAEGCTLTIAPDTVAVRLSGKDSTDNGTSHRLFRYGGPLRIFTIRGGEDTVFKRTDRPQWDADTIKTLLSFRLRVNAIVALVFINPFTSKSGEYGLTVGDCTGTITVEDF